MPFCINCGKEVSPEAKFCPLCGVRRNTEQTSTDYRRKQEFSGKLYKCPNCGEVLNSFTSHCPACGLELRGTRAISSVREFALKLEAIEAHREYEKPGGLFAQAAARQQISKTDEQKISLIRSFSIPNTKEDILEFMILATSNLDSSLYGSTDTPSAGAKAIAEAWNGKIKQVYAKAKATFLADSEFARIQELYDSCYAEVKRQKKKRAVKWILLVGWLPLLLIVEIVWFSISDLRDESAEIARLEAIVEEVQENLDDQEYKLALRNADSIDYQEHDVEQERRWDIQREYWVDKVLEEAEKAGVPLEYSPSDDVDNANKVYDDNSEDKQISSGVVDGFVEAVEPSVDETKKNFEEFTQIVTSDSTENN